MKNSISLLVMSLVFIPFFWTNKLLATVKPKLEDLVCRSTWVVVAKVIGVENLGAKQRQVLLQPKRLLKGQFTQPPKTLVINYQKIGKGDINFVSMKDQADYIFMLRAIPDEQENIKAFHLELTDAWFGVEAIQPGLIEKVNSFAKSC